MVAVGLVVLAGMAWLLHWWLGARASPDDRSGMATTQSESSLRGGTRLPRGKGPEPMPHDGSSPEITQVPPEEQWAQPLDAVVELLRRAKQSGDDLATRELARQLATARGEELQSLMRLLCIEAVDSPNVDVLAELCEAAATAIDNDPDVAAGALLNLIGGLQFEDDDPAWELRARSVLRLAASFPPNESGSVNATLAGMLLRRDVAWAPTRRSVMLECGPFGAAEFVEALERIAVDGSERSRDRITAMRVLAELGRDEAGVGLVRSIRAMSSVAEKRSALLALVAIPDASASVHALALVIEDDPDLTPLDALEPLHQWRDHHAPQHTRNFVDLVLDSETLDVERMGGLMLQSLATPRAHSLRSQMIDPNVRERLAAAFFGARRDDGDLARVMRCASAAGAWTFWSTTADDVQRAFAEGARRPSVVLATVLARLDGPERHLSGIERDRFRSGVEDELRRILRTPEGSGVTVAAARTVGLLRLEGLRSELEMICRDDRDSLAEAREAARTSLERLSRSR